MSDVTDAGRRMYELMAELYPICRSITGEGFRETLRRLQRHIPLEIHEVPSGTRVFDWTVPKERNIRDAYVKNSRGERVIDFQASNLHVVSYSVPVHERMPLGELRKHLFTLPKHPGWIPYRTSYYDESWGFCLAHDRLLALEDDTYEVFIDSSLTDGHLTYGECCLPGETPDEVLLSCHACHPSLCNDNLSGVTLVTMLAAHLEKIPRHYSYRCLFIPGTIGSIAWLSLHQEQAARIRHGLVVTLVGDPGHSTYKKSRRGDAVIDRAAAHVLKTSGQPYEIVDFSPYGYDERQYCSPGFDLPVGCLMRTPHGQFPEYHTSADDLSLVQPEYLADSFAKYLAVIEILEHNRRYVNRNPKCEPQLGRRGLYSKDRQMATLWVLNLSDGRHSLLDIAERSGLPFRNIREAADLLAAGDLLQACPEDGSSPSA